MQALVVDDSRTTRLILGHLLKQVGFGVVEAGNGRDGLVQLKSQGKIDLVLVDWNMPEMDGPAFIRAVRADPAHRDLRLIMVTGEEDAAHETLARDAGADGLLRKPFTRDVLLAALAGLGIELT